MYRWAAQSTPIRATTAPGSSDRGLLGWMVGMMRLA